MRYYFIKELDELVAMDEEMPNNGVEITKEEYELYSNPPRGAIRIAGELDFKPRYFFKESVNGFIVDKFEPSDSIEISKEDYDLYTNPPEGKVRTFGKMAFEVDAIYEHNWVISELQRADIEISLHLDGDERSTLSEESWRNYRKDLRNYTTMENGFPVVNGIRPSVS